MVAAPHVAVVFEDVFGRHAERRLPGDAVSGAVGHDQIRNETRTETTVDILALEHPGHRPLAVLWIRQPGQPTDELFPQRFVGGTRFEALRERSEEHTSELQSRENLVCRLLLEK